MGNTTAKLILALSVSFFVGTSVFVGTLRAQEHPFDRKADWKGFDQFHFSVADRPAYIVAPKRTAPGQPWVWRARFPNYHAEIDLALLERGFHVAHIDVAGLFGGTKAVQIGDDFYRYATEKWGLSSRPCLEGVSRGGLFVYNWAVGNTDKVSCIYCDTPVCDFKSWPGGKGSGLGAESAWQQCLKAYELSEEQALQFNLNPIDHAPHLAKSKIPILHIVAENDRVVPPSENTYVLQQRLKQHGHDLDVISVPLGTEASNGHHFDHPQIDRAVEFISQHCGATAPSLPEVLNGSQRVVFLGNSITYAGHYVAFFDAWLLTQKKDKTPILVNVGLPSETVSGLSEEGHAGGRFPRPHLDERLDRVLSVTQPDLVLACYGINCGIYQPFDLERFRRYQQGIENLKDKVEDAGAQLVLITPPMFDDQRAKKSFSYNSVLAEYAQWLLSKREAGWFVIDLHGPMTREVSNRRETDSEFTFQPDAVHPDDKGHWFIAQQLIRAFDNANAAVPATPQKMLVASQDQDPDQTLQLVRQRMSVRRDAYLGAAGHLRPGVREGLPITQAEQRAREITAQILEQKGKSP